MTKLWILLLSLGFFLSGCSAQPVTEVPTEESIKVLEKSELNSSYIEWYGRHAYQNEREYFYHTATGFRLEFYGRVIDIELRLEDKNHDIYYSYAKDGEDLLTSGIYVQSEFESTLRIEFDTYDHHVVELVKRSEPEDGLTSLHRISTNGYLKEVTIPEDQPHFLLIGASGISGHGALGSPGQPRTTENSSSLHSFGYLTAAHFEGSYEFVSNSGWGLAFGYNDVSGEDNIVKAYDYIGIDPDQQIIDITYDHAKQPDFIIINIGGNDYTSVINKLSGFAKTEKILEFKAAVADFIFKLREDAPEAHILWTMTEGSQNGTAANEVINQLSALDKAFVHMVIIKQVGDDGDLAGANNHASFITHQKSAQLLIDVIEGILNPTV
ncbi:MAG TPA: hypothetical protein DDW82_04235 [Acholeplasmataceae bacterium]|nr:hypothetical protein [Acholeplasmataceae bacterium]HCB67544.1 hypothetical protein [Acholeplasmataceae bacterium]